MARALGINHVALEVGDIQEALAFYGRFLDFEMRDTYERMAFVDLGDQFLALAATGDTTPDRERHFGLVVDDKEEVRETLAVLGVDVPAEGALNFSDPWGNSIDIVDYRDIQFTKAPEVLAAMGATGLGKTAEAQADFDAKFGA